MNQNCAKVSRLEVRYSEKCPPGLSPGFLAMRHGRYANVQRTEVNIPQDAFATLLNTDQHRRATTEHNVHMSGITANFKMLNTGGGKTVFGAWPNHDSAAKTTDLATSRTNCVPIGADQSRKMLGDPRWMILLCQKVIQIGNAG